MAYHYGQVIREHRELRCMTQARLASLWPKADGGEGVNTRYVQDIEYGRKQIRDQGTLRKLASILDIPFWKFGLSEYDPFHPQALPGRGRRMFDETLNAVEQLIGQIWSLRCAARIVDAEKGVQHLNALFAFYRDQLPPPSRLETRFQLLHIQARRLNAVTLLENGQYDETIRTFEKMLEAARGLDDAASTALALNELGKELERKGEKDEAVALLEEARDVSLQAGKLVMAFVHSYLARVYASAGESRRFERTIETGLTIAHGLNSYPDSTDFVYSWSPISALLAEKSWGYLNIGQPAKTLAMRDEIEQAIAAGQDARLYTWIPLDWARAYLQLGEVEAGVEAIREFQRRITAMRSPHASRQTSKYLADLDAAGYSNVKAVRDVHNELSER